MFISCPSFLKKKTKIKFKNKIAVKKMAHSSNPSFSYNTAPGPLQANKTVFYNPYASSFSYPYVFQQHLGPYTNNPNLINQTKIQSIYHPNTFIPSVINNSSMYPCNAYVPPTCLLTNYPATPWYVLNELKIQNSLMNNKK